MSTATVPSTAQTRDHRIDFYRGIALAMIFVNHIPDNVWENVTSRNFGFSDSAEVFVFLAGFASAYAYGRDYLGGMRLVSTLKAWRRAGVLYLVHIALTMFAVGLFTWGSLAFGRGEMLEHLGLATFVTRPLETILGLVTLGHQLGYVNILPMYSALLLMLPILLTLARFGVTWLMAGSIGFWAVSNILSLDVPNFPYPGGWFFNPFTWQLIFSIGLSCGLSKWQRGTTVPYDRRLAIPAFVYLFLAFVFVRLDVWGVERELGLPITLIGFDKTFVSLPRLLHLLCVVYLFSCIPPSYPLGTVSPDNPLTRMGRHSLPVFTLGTVLSLVAQLIKFGRPPHFLFDTALVAAGLALQVGLAFYLDWWRTVKRNRAARTSIPVRRPVEPLEGRAVDGDKALRDVAGERAAREASRR